jgi:hypothetical protein
MQCNILGMNDTNIKNWPSCTATCEECGKVYHRRGIHHELKHHFCSRKCWQDFRSKNRVTLYCAICKKKMVLVRSRYNDKIRMGTKPERITCSNECANLLPNLISKRDQYTPFKNTFQRILRENIKCKKQKTKNKHKQCRGCFLTLDDVRNQFLAQNGLCAYTNLPLILQEVTYLHYHHPRAASLDRIDCNKPYQKGNVQFVCRSINYAKSSFSDAEFKAFLEEMVQSYIQNKKNYQTSPDGIPKKEGTQDESPLSITLAQPPA